MTRFTVIARPTEYNDLAPKWRDFIRENARFDEPPVEEIRSNLIARCEATDGVAPYTRPSRMRSSRTIPSKMVPRHSPISCV